jgi:hypothetical protein
MKISGQYLPFGFLLIATYKLLLKGNSPVQSYIEEIWEECYKIGVSYIQGF